MSDEIATPTTEETKTSEVVEPQGDNTDWKAEARKWESRAKADHEVANKWREYEQSQKSEHEKLAEELARAQAEASQASATLLRYEVAAEKGISGAALDLLTGTTREELVANADKLLSLIADQSKPKAPKPDENQGKPAPSALGQLTKADLSAMTPAEIMEAKKAGRLDELMGKL
jgi:hypothetical protein